jgi:hypothetical protein
MAAGEMKKIEKLRGLDTGSLRALAETMRHPPLGTATIAIIVAGAVIPAQSAQAQNLVQNPGFEDSTSDTTSPGWKLDMSRERFTGFANNSVFAHTGTWSANFGDLTQQDATIDTLSQVIPTVPMTTYLIIFFLSDYGTGSDKSFVATFDGQTVLSLTSQDTSPYTFYSASVVATSSEATLAFAGQNPSSQFFLDDVSVEPAPAPVPGAGGLSLIVGAVMLAGSRLRRMRRKPA